MKTCPNVLVAEGSTEDDYLGQVRATLARYATSNGLAGEVIDFGCAAGRLGRELRRHEAVRRVLGVEVDPDAARAARLVLDGVFEGSLTDADLWSQLPAVIDGFLFADVLEHVAEPAVTLRLAVGRLRSGGTAVFSIPNVNYFRVLTDLILRGKWEYSDQGVLDRTHLRFFTIDGALSLVEEVGLSVCDVSIPLTRKAARLAVALPPTRRFLAAQTYITARKR